MTADRRHVSSRSQLSRFAPFVALLLALLTLPACNIAKWGMYVMGGDGSGKNSRVAAQYRGLDNQSVAVLVAGDEFTLFENPGVTAAVGRAVSGRIAAAIPGARVANPAQIAQFQEHNPYWNTLPYADLLQRLGVQRLVYVDLVEFRTHEPGNRQLYRGLAVANLGVAEAGSNDPGTLAFLVPVRAQYPVNAAVGMLDGDDQTTRLGLLKTLADEVLHVFRDHQVAQR